MEMNRFALRLVVLLLAVTVHVMGRDPRSLRGIHALRVVVEDLSSAVEQAGLHRTDIQTDVELKLRLAGIKVLPEDAQPLSPYLYVNANVHANVILGQYDSGRHSYAVDCELHQYVILARDESIRTMAATWIVGFAGTSNLQQIRDSIKDLVDEFINDYLSVNPKK